MSIEQDDVREMMSQIWGGMLQIDLCPLKIVPSRLEGIGACVQITGAWEGAVRVDCDQRLAELATARFLGVNPDEVAIEQIRDAMGELANMSAGAVKPLLPPPCQLSLPTVADGSDYNFTVPHGEVTLASGFEYQGRPMKITILQRKR
ncbi:MAG TPA: chemotaxis protein CheX [Terriglobales bacterium]|nr:chemotaxis protein CheX [Terriglobales bacterium]